MNAIYKRRSIRKYTGEKVPEETLVDFIRAGMNAPSAGNQRPWHFVIIDDRALLNEIPTFHPYAQMLREAPAAILVCGDTSLERHAGYWVQDCSAAVENMLLEIVDRGYGGVWLGIYPREERVEGIRRLLGVPDGIIPFALVAVGRPAEDKPPKNEFDGERIRHNTWR
jgi:nitroreductase